MQVKRQQRLIWLECVDLGFQSFKVAKFQGIAFETLKPVKR